MQYQTENRVAICKILGGPMPNPEADLQLIHMLSERLERLSADSIWAHRASGVRGALLRQIEMTERNRPHDDDRLNALITIGFHILEEAASKRRSVVKRGL
jgi:hypothetical protein